MLLEDLVNSQSVGDDKKLNNVTHVTERARSNLYDYDSIYLILMKMS